MKNPPVLIFTRHQRPAFVPSQRPGAPYLARFSRDVGYHRCCPQSASHESRVRGIMQWYPTSRENERDMGHPAFVREPGPSSHYIFGSARPQVTPRNRNAIIRFARPEFLIDVHDHPLGYTSIGYSVRARVGNDAFSSQVGHHARRAARGTNRRRPESPGFSKPALATDHASDGPGAVCSSLRS